LEESIFNTNNGIRFMLVGMFLILSVAFLTMPVSAETDVMLQAQLEPTFSITVEPSYVDFGTMHIGENEVASTWVNSTGNCPFSVKIRDTGAIGGFSGAGFKFLDGTGTPQYQMQNPLYAKLGAHVYVPIATTDTEIYSGTAGSFTDRISYKQTVTINDRPATAPAKYWTKVTISGAAI